MNDEEFCEKLLKSLRDRLRQLRERRLEPPSKERDDRIKEASDAARALLAQLQEECLDLVPKSVKRTDS